MIFGTPIAFYFHGWEGAGKVLLFVALIIIVNTKPNEREVVLYGKRFWPIIDLLPILHYDYDQLTTAAWAFDDLWRIDKERQGGAMSRRRAERRVIARLASSSGKKSRQSPM